MKHAWFARTALCAGVAMTVTLEARADDTNDPQARAAQVTKLSEEGSALYQARDYRHAVEKFIEAYAIDPDPNLLFNEARCYELMGDNAAALEKYEAFLAKPGADAKARQKAEDSVATLKKGGKPKPAEQTTQTTTQTTTTTAPPAPAESSGLRTAAWVTLGVGVAAEAVGVVMYFVGKSDHDKITDAAGFGQAGQVADMTRAQAEDLKSSGTTKRGIGVGCMIGGGAALVTSAALFYVSRKTPSVTVGFAPTVGGGAAMLGGKF